jgi:hypothetical protein
LLALDRMSTRGGMIRAAANGPAPARLLAHSVGPTLPQTLTELARTVTYSASSLLPHRRRDNRLDPQNPRSILHEAGTDDDKRAFLDSVAQW